MILTDYFYYPHNLTWDYAVQCGVNHGVIRAPETSQFDLCDRRHWQQIAAGNVRKVDLDLNDTIDFPESRFRFIRIRISSVRGDNTDNWQITPFISCAQWVFYAPGQTGKFTVYYAPVVPTAVNAAQLPAGFDLKSAVLCTASQPTPNQLRGISVRNRDSLNSLIGAVLTALAGLTILLTFARLKRAQNILPAD